MSNQSNRTRRGQSGKPGNQGPAHLAQSAAYQVRSGNPSPQRVLASRSDRKPVSRTARSLPRRRSGSASRPKTWMLWLLALAIIVGAAVWQLSPRFTEPAAAMSVQLSMDGFQPGKIDVAAGQSVNVRLVNMDDSFHTDGGGVHEFAIPELGIDAKVDPRSSKVITIAATKAGTYTFYCDVCCGGKENPSMQGTLSVS